MDSPQLGLRRGFLPVASTEEEKKEEDEVCSVIQ
jgi:hypothetical protein